LLYDAIVICQNLYKRGMKRNDPGIEKSPLSLLGIVGAASIALWLVSFLLLRGGGVAGFMVEALLALPASFVICGLVGWILLSRKRAKRLKLLEEQMPLALDVINRALRAGHPVVSAIRLAADEMGDPIGSEFGLIVDETTYGFEPSKMQGTAEGHHRWKSTFSSRKSSRDQIQCCSAWPI